MGVRKPEPTAPVLTPCAKKRPRSRGATGWRLIERTRAGEAEAFGLFFDRHYDAVYRYIGRVVPDRTTVEDLTGDTFFHALRLVPTVRTDGVRPRRWLLNLARHAIRTHYLAIELHTVNAEAQQPGVTNPLPDDVVIDHPDADLVRRILARRHGEQRRRLEARYLRRPYSTDGGATAPGWRSTSPASIARRYAI